MKQFYLAGTKAGLSILICIFLVANCAKAQLDPAKADSFFYFIKANPLRSSVYITRNDTAIARLNENKLMPLASTVTMLVAIEFASGINLFSLRRAMAVSFLVM